MSQPLADALAWHLLGTMLAMRRFDEKVLQFAAEKRFAGHFHVYIGQEATGAAVMATLEARDVLATTHRNHGHIIARGADPGRALAEILGRATGLNGGRGGTFHLCEPALGFLSTSGIVGGCISLAAGGGFACKHRHDGSIAVAFFGDGSLEEGVSFEALNAASLWRLPVLFVCENNSIDAYGPTLGGIPRLNHSAHEDLCQIPSSLGIRAERVDGGDPGAVYECAAKAVAHCRAGEGPFFIEAVTKRWAGSIPQWPELTTGVTDIRMATGESPTGGPHENWYSRVDPVLCLARALATGSSTAVRRIDALDREIRQRIDGAGEFALASPYPDASTALDHVFG